MARLHTKCSCYESDFACFFYTDCGKLIAWLRAAEQSKIKTGAGKIKAGYSLAREQPAGQVNKFFGESIPIVLRKSCRVFAALHRQKKRKAIILYLRCSARGAQA